MAKRIVFGGTWLVGLLGALVLFMVARASSLQASAAPGEVRAMAVASEYFIPASAHAAGAVGTNWRTDVEVHNCGSTQAQYTFYLLRRDTDNGSATSRSYSLGPGQSVRYTDIVSSVFGTDGSAAIRVVVTSGQVMVNSRTFNALADGTFGQFVRGQAASEAIPYGQQGRLFHLTHNRSSASGFRTNIGFVNAGGSTIQIYADLYLASGAYLGRVPRTLRAYEYQQVDKIFESVTGGDVGDGYAIVTTPTVGGRFFAYASVVDNPKGDPIFITAEAIAGGSNPPASPSPSPSSSPAPTATPGTGSLAFRLVWSGVEDLDLHVKEPNGTEIYYDNKGPTSTGGRLDKDCNGPCSNLCASPIENIYWPVGGAPGGTYQFWVNFYDSCSGSTSKSFTIYVYVNGSVYQTINGSITGVHNNSQVYTHTQGGAQPTPGGSGTNLEMVKPTGWANCVICNYRELNPPVYEFLSVYYQTHVYWAAANTGTTTLTGSVPFGLYLDGSQFLTVNYNTGAGWAPGVGLAFHYATTVNSAGTHNLMVKADPANALSETNEGDNTCSFNGEWTTIVFNSPGDGLAALTNPERMRGSLVTLAPSDVVKLQLPPGQAWTPSCAPLPPKQ